MHGCHPVQYNDATDIPICPNTTLMMRQSQWMSTPQYSLGYPMPTATKTSNATWNKDFALSVGRKDIKHANVLIERNSPSRPINIIRKEPLVLHLVDHHSSNTPTCQNVPKASESLTNPRQATLMHALHS